MVELYAFLFLGIWFLLQLYSGTFSLVADCRQVGGIAWWAHVGGWLGGIALLRLLRVKRRG
ncbi:MAG TPA: rhomboid family intramembrane serine protease [Thermodesulforhabdus norvegica]|uniref:Rhomboid family intramembrane serine protease n=1 Tax=Thermodesulforhabdus norvegica TaxID=39841 RepID=A0A7C1AYK6_9BACT|nr:rhomboid family intramembrane serine protease [Thermodesulforhabdus norvegica]